MRRYLLGVLFAVEQCVCSGWNSVPTSEAVHNHAGRRAQRKLARMHIHLWHRCTSWAVYAARRRVKEIEADGRVQWRYLDSRGNTVITDEWGEKSDNIFLPLRSE